MVTADSRTTMSRATENAGMTQRRNGSKTKRGRSPFPETIENGLRPGFLPIRGVMFKGGTCLAKVHYGFHRLSEDIDFGVSMPSATKRKERQQAAAKAKTALARAIERSGCFQTTDELRGANNSTQYLGAVSYQSQLGDRSGTIKIEISLREPMINAPQMLPAHTVILNPVTGRALVAARDVLSIARVEALAERFRAAMSCRDIAIRDYFDIAHALPTSATDVVSDAFAELVRSKLAVPGNDPVDLSPPRMNALREQVETILKPVLRPKDFAAFDLDQAIAAVVSLAEKLAPRR
jgi:predicted nucleotidyltransferase component of viral defense system